MALTPEQLALRRSKITATDAAKVCGVNPYGGPLDVQLDKQGHQVFVDNDRARWGNILEDPIRQDFEERKGLVIAVPGTLVHPTEEWAAATPDGIEYLDGTPIYYGTHYSHGPEDAEPCGGLEIKTHTAWLSHKYGEPGSDEVPAGELVQCAWNLWIASAVWPGADWNTWDLTAFLDGLPTDYVIQRDEELEEMMIATCRAFHAEHVIEGIPVDPDGTASYAKHQAARLPRHLTLDLVTAEGELLEDVLELHDKRREIAALEGEEARLVQVIKEAIGDHAGLEFPAIGAPPPQGRRKPKKQRITWKRAKDSNTTAWAKVVGEFRPQLEASSEEFEDARRLLEALEAAIKAHTTVKPGSRRFNVPRNWNN